MLKLCSRTVSWTCLNIMWICRIPVIEYEKQQLTIAIKEEGRDVSP